MRPPRLLARLALAVLPLLLAPALADAAEPPNGNDRCSSAGRNTCGTLGVGFYDTYRYGVRWFGDYRGVLPGEAHTFCLDLRFWYPTPAYRYRAASAEGLRNRDGEAVPVGRLQRIAYAMWTHGQTSDRVQQAAVMLYVHAMMGDGAPGEVDPAAISPEVAARYARIARDADRYRGPYRIDVDLPDDLEVGRPVTATVRVRAASGALVPNLRLRLGATGTRGVPASVRTNGSGLARVALTPTRAAGLRLEVGTTLASTLPRVFTPSTPAAARNAQRLAAPASQELERAVTATVAQATPTIATVATPDHLLVGEDSTDRTTLGGVAPGYRATIAVRLYGPFRSAGEIACDGVPAWEGTLAVDGPGEYTTPVAQPTRPGWYVYQQTLPGDADHAGVVTPCGDPLERVRVEVQPVVVTQVSSTVTAPGSVLTDTVAVSGLAGETVTVHAALYGPFPSATTMSCDVPALWGGSFTAAGDGTYVTEPVTLTVPGYYTYREWIDASELVRAGTTACAEAAETTVVPGTPQVVTQISAQEARPGATITDTVVVSGLGVLTATVQAELWGPYATLEAMTCTGTPAWSGSFTANGDGTYTTEPVPLAVAGYYTYREAIAATPANQAAATACGEAAETVLVSAQPTVTTIVSSEVVRPGSRISDEIRVRGLGQTSARIEVELFGPFASRAAMRCDGTPFWRGQVTAKGDGTITSPAVRVGKAGFYTYRERLLDAPNVAGTTTECALEVETALSAPAITTGRGDTTREVRGEDVGGQTPTRVRAPGIDAAVSPVIIDAASGALGVPADIRRAGWWRDGAAPGSRTGAILIAGHLDSARAGLGAFFRLPAIDRGDRVTVTTRSGRTYGYRVTSVRAYRKADLPVNVYSRRGAGRLVLVTCGGPFDPVAGHYRDNIVVTAVPG